MGYLQPSRKSRKHRHKHEQQQEYCLHGLYASTTNHQPTNRIDPPLMSDRRSIVYYLPASEHKMRKILPRLVSSKALTAKQVKVNLRSLRVSYTARNILFCTSAADFIADRRSANVVV